jgi:hypothetical protein
MCGFAKRSMNLDETSQAAEGIGTLTEEEAKIFKYIDDYKPRTLRLATPLKGFLPNYEPALHTNCPILSFLSVS